MRVSFKMFSSEISSNLSTSAEKLLDAQTRVTTGKRILRPSDDISGTGKAISLRSTISQIEQSVTNADNINSSLSVANSAMNTMIQSIQQAQSLALSMANSTVPDTSRASLSTQIDDIMDTLISAANTEYSGNYVFAGSRTDVKPFTNDSNTNTPSYNGDNIQTMVQAAPGMYIARNITADTIFNIGGASIPGTPDILSTLKQLKEDIASGNIDSISSQVANVKANLNNVIALRSQIGSRISKVETLKNNMLDSKDSFSEMLSGTEDVDLADAVIKLNEHENVYQAALASANKIMNLSLVNYLN